MFHGRIPFIVLDLKLGILTQQIHIPTSQNAQDVLDRTEMIYQDVPRNTMQAYIIYKIFYDKKANDRKLTKQIRLFVLQSKADHQCSKISFTEFRRVGSSIIENVSPNNRKLVRKVGINKTQMLHRMQLLQFTPLQPLADVQNTPQEWISDPEMSIRHDDLYARA